MQGRRKAASAFSMGRPMRTSVYIDGFNLYYNAVKGTPYKWLDLLALAQYMLPGHDIGHIRYFTARVQSTPSDPQKAQRQDVYLRALRTIPNLTIHEGSFSRRQASMPLAKNGQATNKMVTVIKTEEKGSDVNLASYLLMDGVDKAYEQAAVISNDSDLVTPIVLVRKRLQLQVGVLCPECDPRLQSGKLKRAARFFKAIPASALEACQFDPWLVDANGSFHKPAGW